MSPPTYFLSWESHRSNICNGLSILQQNEEFVDMTLAADGHHVKVHQMVVALASPYIKELISGTDSRHPIIFLHKTSYATLSAILEYIYTGEVVIAMENMEELIQAAKELRIRGLEDMKIQTSKFPPKSFSPVQEQEHESIENIVDVHYIEEESNTISQDYKILDTGLSNADLITPDNMEEYVEVPVGETEETPDVNGPQMKLDYDSDNMDTADSNHEAESPAPAPTIQYTVSNQGSLQMILNRFMYYLKHCNRNNSRQWRCVDYLNSAKCPAIVVTDENDVVVQRIAAHNHTFHDKRILRKVTANAVYTALQDAEIQGTYVRSKSVTANETVIVQTTK